MKSNIVAVFSFVTFVIMCFLLGMNFVEAGTYTIASMVSILILGIVAAIGTGKSDES